SSREYRQEAFVGGSPGSLRSVGGRILDIEDGIGHATLERFPASCRQPADRQLLSPAVLPHERMLPGHGGEIVSRPLSTGTGEDESPRLRRAPLLDAPLECSNLPIGEGAGLVDLESLKEFLGCPIGLRLEPAA